MTIKLKQLLHTANEDTLQTHDLDGENDQGLATAGYGLTDGGLWVPKKVNDDGEQAVNIINEIPEGSQVIGKVNLNDGTNGLVINSNGDIGIVPMDSNGNEIFTDSDPGEVNINSSLPSGNNIIGSVNLDDGTNALIINADGNISIVPVDSDNEELFTDDNPGSVKQVGSNVVGGTGGFQENRSGSLDGNTEEVIFDDNVPIIIDEFYLILATDIANSDSINFRLAKYDDGNNKRHLAKLQRTTGNDNYMRTDRIYKESSRISNIWNYRETTSPDEISIYIDESYYPIICPAGVYFSIENVTDSAIDIGTIINYRRLE